MPIITVTLIEGYEDSVRTRLSECLSDVARAVISAPAEGVTVVVNEVKPSNYMRGRQRRTPGQPPVSPCELVRTYLEAMEARDLDSARTLLAENFSMMFPGGVVFQSLEELTSWAAKRYRAVRKSYEGFDEALIEGGAVVYCHGTLSGESLSGRRFAGVRFVDRFLVTDGELVTQSVWNDLAESGVLD
jgi:phenylpyruvate tautomerase PptA (4-oxalocrotonate tautomerase family)